MNEQLARRIVEELIHQGVQEFVVCPGSRNSPLVYLLEHEEKLSKYYTFEERSAAFFALGRGKRTGLPVAVVTTSGTAAGELLPATMEAYYTGIPLVLVTADRPRRFRTTGAPQTAVQPGLFGIYALHEWDLAHDEPCDLSIWERNGPIHINVCFEEPARIYQPSDQGLDYGRHPCEKAPLDLATERYHLEQFLRFSNSPFVVVSTLNERDREAVTQFLLQLRAPVYLEGISGLRCDRRLNELRIMRSDNILAEASKHGYQIDGVLRIGGVPTFRTWRDLEDTHSHIPVLSLYHLPFSGLSHDNLICAPLDQLLSPFRDKSFPIYTSHESWKVADQHFWKQASSLFKEEPRAEQSLVHALSQRIDPHSFVFVGTSLPIREWDQTAYREGSSFSVAANRGLNGIDGEISTFLGMAEPQRDNWALLGDLTTLYDFAGLWFTDQLPHISVQLAVINNSGGQIFSRMYHSKAFLNSHSLNFEHFAGMWKLPYERWEIIPANVKSHQSRLIEIVPDEEATQRVWKKLHQLT